MRRLTLILLLLPLSVWAEITLLDPTTSAANSQQFTVTDKGVTVKANALAGAEEADIQILIGTTWKNTGDSLTATYSAGIISGDSPGRYRVAKDATASSCGIYLSTADSP